MAQYKQIDAIAITPSIGKYCLLTVTGARDTQRHRDWTLLNISESYKGKIIQQSGVIGFTTLFKRRGSYGSIYPLHIHIKFLIILVDGV